MDEALNNACRQFGWENLYKLLLPDNYIIESRINRPECDCLSPFPGSTDKRKSFAFNVSNGLWNDQHMRDRLVGCKNNGGNVIMFHAYLNFYTIDSKGRVHGDMDAAERDLRIKLGLAIAIDTRWFEACRARMATSTSKHHLAWAGYKPWQAEILAKMQVGYDTETERIVFGTRDYKGNLINAKLYRPGPGTGSKAIWKNSGIGPQNVPWPSEVAWGSKKPFFFVEGEPDCLSMLSIGIPAITGTMGANDVPYLGPYNMEFCAARDIIVCMDPDTAGEIYAAKVIATIHQIASSIRQIHVPEWPGMPAKRDISDYITYLYVEGNTKAQIRAIIMQMANEAEAIGIEAKYDMEPVEMLMKEAMNTNNYGTRFITRVRTISIAQSRHMIPEQLECHCKEDKSYCNGCVMYNRGGLWNKSIDARSKLALDASFVDNDRQLKMFKRDFGVPEQCPSFRANVLSVADVQIVQVSKPLDTSNLESIAAEDINTRRAEVFYISRENQILEIGQDYDMRGFAYPIGRNQKAVILADKMTRIINVSQATHLTAEQCFRLRKTFNPQGMNVTDALNYIAEDLSNSVTGIRNRLDLHLMYRAVFHSAIEFNLAGEHVGRGWIEAFVLGDTRCGKSAAFKSMSNWYNTGVLVDCKNQTVPGLLGAVETSVITGERFVIPGLVPLNDRKGPICFDEFTGPNKNKHHIIESLSSTRAEGVVSITKAAHARFSAKVRSIWLANPGGGKLLNDIPGTGVERMRNLIGQPEDIARFDMAMAVTQADVSIEILLSPIVLSEPKINRDDAKLLMEWSRSREPDNFIWEEEAITTLKTATRRMIDMYDQSIPLVESATQRLKIAKLSVSNALCTFSSSNGTNVIITKDHVLAAYYMFSMWYQKPCFAYHTFSERKRIESGIDNEEEVQKLLEEEFGTYIVQYLYNLTRMERFTETIFRIVCPGRSENSLGILRVLLQNRCIETTGHRQEFTMTRVFVRWVDNYLKSREQMPRRTEENNAETESII